MLFSHFSQHKENYATTQTTIRNLFALQEREADEKVYTLVDPQQCQGGATVTTDSNGNLLVTKGRATEYPCVVAHMDQVQDTHSKDFRAVETKDYILGFSLNNKQQEGLGADDKNGIWVALKCLQRYDNIKCAFFMGEEIGCVGSSAVDLSFFDDCRFVLQCDRRNGNDLITSVMGELCSDEFLADTDYEKYGYKETHG